MHRLNTPLHKDIQKSVKTNNYYWLWEQTKNKWINISQRELIQDLMPMASNASPPCCVSTSAWRPPGADAALLCHEPPCTGCHGLVPVNLTVVLMCRHNSPSLSSSFFSSFLSLLTSGKTVVITASCCCACFLLGGTGALPWRLWTGVTTGTAAYLLPSQTPAPPMPTWPVPGSPS